MKKLILAFLLSTCAVSPAFAGGFSRFIEGMFALLIMLFIVWGVLMLIPIITAIIGVSKDNEGLKKFSKIYSTIWIIIMSVSAFPTFSPVSLLSSLFLIGVAAIPLLIVKISENNSKLKE